MTKIISTTGKELYNRTQATLKATVVAAVTDGANLRSADLGSANLGGANLGSANIMPDGRAWQAYRADHMAGVCDDPDVREKALAAWGNHSWHNCPTHAAYGWNSFADVPADKLIAVAAWIALYDAGLLDKPANGVDHADAA